MAGLLAGQYCARILADLGAEVIKVERGPTGDPLRTKAIDGRPDLFPYANAGKKSLCLRPDVPEALDVIRDLAHEADVVVESFVPAADEAWQCDYEALRATNRRLIVCSVTPFG